MVTEDSDLKLDMHQEGTEASVTSYSIWTAICNICMKPITFTNPQKTLLSGTENVVYFESFKGKETHFCMHHVGERDNSG